MSKKLESFSSILENWNSGKTKAISEKVYDETPKSKEPEKKIEILKGIKLPYFPDDMLCVPNEIARSGLFPPTNKIELVEDPLTKKLVRVRYNNLPVPSWSDNVEIYYSGSQVTQFDGHVWMECVSRAKRQELGTVIRFTAYDLCKSLGLSDGGKAYDLAYDSIERLFQASLKIKVFKNINEQRRIIKEYNDHFISSFEIDKVTKEYLISLNPRLASLYACETTWIDRELLNTIQGSVARAILIHAYAHESSEDKPQYMPIEKLHKVTNIKSSLREFRRTQVKLEKQFIEKGVFKTYKLKDGVITLCRVKKKNNGDK